MSSPAREERLHGYRRAVEQLLGDRLGLAREDALDRFFEYVEACFEHRVGERSCARAWIAHAITASDAA